MNRNTKITMKGSDNILHDIYELLNKENKGDVPTTIRDLKDLKEEMNENHFWDFINKKALENDISPCCLEELETKVIGNEEYEFWGKIIKEDIRKAVCKKCGRTYE